MAFPGSINHTAMAEPDLPSLQTFLIACQPRSPLCGATLSHPPPPPQLKQFVGSTIYSEWENCVRAKEKKNPSCLHDSIASCVEGIHAILLGQKVGDPSFPPSFHTACSTCLPFSATRSRKEAKGGGNCAPSLFTFLKQRSASPPFSVFMREIDGTWEEEKIEDVSFSFLWTL